MKTENRVSESGKYVEESNVTATNIFSRLCMYLGVLIALTVGNADVLLCQSGLNISLSVDEARAFQFAYRQAPAKERRADIRIVPGETVFFAARLYDPRGEINGVSIGELQDALRSAHIHVFPVTFVIGENEEGRDDFKRELINHFMEASLAVQPLADWKFRSENIANKEIVIGTGPVSFGDFQEYGRYKVIVHMSPKTGISSHRPAHKGIGVFSNPIIVEVRGVHNKEDRMFFNYLEATRASRQGDLDKALDHVDELLEENPTHSKAHALRAYIMTEKGEMDQALKSLDAAIEHEVRNKGIVNGAGNRLVLYWTEIRNNLLAKHEQQFGVK